MNKEEISTEIKEENPLHTIKRILLCFNVSLLRGGNLIKIFFTRRSKSNKAGENNSHINMEPGFKLRNNPYFAIPGHQFLFVYGGSWNNKKTVMPVSHTVSV